MATMRERVEETEQAGVEVQAAAAPARRELADWQAQLLAVVITVAATTLLVLGFSALTGGL